MSNEPTQMTPSGTVIWKDIQNTHPDKEDQLRAAAFAALQALEDFEQEKAYGILSAIEPWLDKTGRYVG